MCVLNNGGCSQLCLPTSEHSRSCWCSAGYSLTADRSTCRGEGSAALHYTHLFITTVTPTVHRSSFTYSLCSGCCLILVPCAGVDAFLMYSSQDGIRGVSLDPTDHSDTLIPISGPLIAAGLDFHAGEELLSFSKFIISNSVRSEINAH